MVIQNEIITLDKRIVLENGTIVNRFTHILPGATIGENCMIGERCYIGSKAIIGDRARIQNGNDLWDGVIIYDDVFIGPHCNLTNHHDPSDRGGKFTPDETIICDGAVISTNVTIIAPCKIGSKARIGAGSVVLRDVMKKEQVNWLVK